MSGMEAGKMTIGTSKFNATIKNSKRKSNVTSVLTYLQHFNQLSVYITLYIFWHSDVYHILVFEGMLVIVIVCFLLDA